MPSKRRYFEFVGSDGICFVCDEDELRSQIEEWMGQREQEDDDGDDADFRVAVVWMTREEYEALPNADEAL